AASAAALGKLGDAAKRSVPALLEALKDRDPSPRRAAAEALGQLGREDGVLPALLAAVGDPDAGVGRAAEAAVVQGGKLGPGAATDRRRLLGSERAAARASAAGALGGLGPDAAGEAVEPLRKALKDRAVRVRTRAAQALGSFGPAAKAALPSLTESL